jgi:leucyl/phenylalanyl-tRNA--protein transferase
MPLFPHPENTTNEGILAVGGDLSVERLKLAYQWGVFPWYGKEDPIIWWNPDPRYVIYPSKIKVAKSMRPYFNQQKFSVTYDQEFERVITYCQKVKREGQHDTWITAEMKAAYIALHKEGIAHSVEVWDGDDLVGGLYGVALGKIFSGESMFSLASNASKYGFITLARKLESLDYWVIDCQQPNPYLATLGGENIPRSEYMQLIRKNVFEGDRWE